MINCKVLCFGFSKRFLVFSLRFHSSRTCQGLGRKGFCCVPEIDKESVGARIWNTPSGLTFFIWHGIYEQFVDLEFILLIPYQNMVSWNTILPLRGLFFSINFGVLGSERVMSLYFFIDKWMVLSIIIHSCSTSGFGHFRF